MKPWLIVVLGVGLLVAALFTVVRRAPAPAPAPSAGATAAAPAPVASRERPAPLDMEQASEDLTAAVDAFAEQIKVNVAKSPKTVLDETLKDGKGPIDYKTALENTLRKRRGAAVEAANLMTQGMDDVDDTFLFQHSLALAKHSNPEVSTVLLNGLDTAPPRLRPHLVFALRGSNEPRVVERFLSLYTADDDPKVRAKAGFILGERGKRLDPALAERARRTARADLQAEDKELVESAADVLGIPPLEPNDKRMLMATVRRDPSEERRLAALRALAASGTQIGELVPLLQELTGDRSTPPKLRDAAQNLLGALPR